MKAGFMKARIVTSLLSLVVVGSVGCSLGGLSTDRAAVSRGDEVAQFKPIQPEEWRLENGLRVVYLKDDELPLVKGRLFIRGGSLWGPESPVGAVSAMGDQMRQGGAGADPRTCSTRSWRSSPPRCRARSRRSSVVFHSHPSHPM